MDTKIGLAIGAIAIGAIAIVVMVAGYFAYNFFSHAEISPRTHTALAAYRTTLSKEELQNKLIS